MKICVITPVPDLTKFASLGDAHLLLCHLVGPDNEYTNFYKNRKELKILDNNLFEFHQAAPTSEIIEKARMVDADVVIAPDVLYDPIDTVKSAEAFAKEIFMENGRRRGRGQKPLQMMAVPQAGSRKGYLWCYDQLANKLGFQWIGLSILACPESFQKVTRSKEVKPNRIAAYRALKETGLWNPKVNHHLLGLGTHVDEVEFFAPIKEIISNDSSSPIVHGQAGLIYVDGAVPGGKLKDKLNFEMASNIGSHAAILNNIQKWRDFANFNL